MRFFVLFAAVMIVAAARGQTVDKPATAEDLSTALADEKAHFDDQMRFVDRVTKALREAAGDSADPAKLGPFVHAQLLACLAAGDHRRALSRLYGRATAEAGRIAAEWETKGKTAAGPAASDSRREFARQIEEAEHRLRELGRKVDTTPEDRDEMAGLSARVRQIRSVLGLFDQVVKQSDPSRYTKAAAEMRRKELLFQRSAEEAELEAAAADMQCRAGMLALRSLKEQEDIEKQLSIWQVLPATGVVSKRLGTSSASREK